MWALLYVVMMPAVGGPAWLAIAVIAAVLLGGGIAAGRWAGAGPFGGVRVGAAIGLIDLLVLGSLLGGDRPGEVVLEGLGWIAGFLVAAVILGAIGAAVGRRAAPPAISWTPVICLVTAATTFMLIVAGGIVTGLEAGLAVPGWLTAFDYPLVLFPLRLMQEDGGVYAEHTHRLWGLLVGLSTILLVIHLWMTEPRRWVVRLAALLLLAVIAQGTLGGTRVTEQSMTLAIVHGIFGQVVFAGMAVMVVLTTAAFVGWTPGAARGIAPMDRTAATLLPVALLVQLALGATYRHLNAEADVAAGVLNGALGGHLVVAAVVITAAIFVGGRTASAHADVPQAQRLGLALLGLVPLQLLLGIAALTAVLLRADDAGIPVYEVALTTLHQATGALILATSFALAVWLRRLEVVAPAATPTTTPA
jgi:cytochrome c oxidase assembly protein subunit 15